jgi:excisionase family DNA binding protein
MATKSRERSLARAGLGVAISLSRSGRMTSAGTRRTTRPMPPLSLTFDDRFVDVLAQRVAAIVVAEVGESGRSPWVDAVEAAEHLRCPVSRIRKLTMTGELPSHHEGRRVLYRRNELDDYVLRRSTP